ncbi:MAG: O-antigen ligase family protein [Patescibacteria group bacterium]|nr:O-antigen ligase family protein [Patescibacteria group bacterium]
MLYFLTIFLITFTLIAWRNLPTALAIIVILLPTYLIRFYIICLPTTLLEIMILIVLTVWFLQTGFQKIAKRYKKEISYKPFPFQTQIILIIIFATISIFVAPNIWKAMGLWRAYFLEPILFFLIFVQVIKTKKNLRKILYALGISALAVSFFAIYQKITGNFIPVEMWRPEETRRVTSFFTSPNAVGLFLSPIIMIYFGWLFENRFKNIIPALFKILVLIFSITAVIFTISQGTYAGLIIAFIFFACLIIKTKITNTSIPRSMKVLSKIFFVLFICISLFSVIYFQNQLINKYAQKIINSPSAQNRIVLLEGSFEYLTQNPKNFILGAGIFGFPKIQEKFREPLKMEPLIYPHNIFLNFWMDIGFFGMLCFVWLIISFFLKIKKSFSERNKIFFIGISASMITIIIHGLLDAPYFKNDLSLLFWIILGIFIATNTAKNKKQLNS